MLELAGLIIAIVSGIILPIFFRMRRKRKYKLMDSSEGVNVYTTRIGRIYGNENIIQIDQSQRSEKHSCNELRKGAHNIPFVTIGTLFRGREANISELHDFLNPSRSECLSNTVIHGASGIGKTRLAIEYAWRHLKSGRYDNVFFVEGDNVLERIASLGGPQFYNLEEYHSSRFDHDLLSDLVLKCLSLSKKWLMIIDNVDSHDSQKRIRNIFPKLSMGNLIVTSRLANWPNEIKSIVLTPIELEESASYILDSTQTKRTVSERDEILAKELARLLEGFPIAIEQTACYINYLGIGLADYINAFQKTKKEILSWHNEGLSNYPVSVLSAWRTTESKLSMPALAIIRLASLYGVAPIPNKLFDLRPNILNRAIRLLDDERKIDKEVDSSDDKAKMVYDAIQSLQYLLNPEKDKSDTRIMESIGELTGWSLISISSGNIYIHGLIKDCFRLNIPMKYYRRWLEIAKDLLKAFIPQITDQDDVRSYFAVNDIYESHLKTIVAHEEEIHGL